MALKIVIVVAYFMDKEADRNYWWIYFRVYPGYIAMINFIHT